jgi:RHS repeat-associated protein
MVSQGTTQAMLWAPGVDQLLAIQERLGGSGLIKQPVWALTDHLGTVKDYLAKAPTAGAESGLLLTRRYSAFGTPVAAKVWSTLPIANFTDINGKSGFFYVGQEYDATTGLQYSRARYYDPVSSEFISQDPLGFAGGDTNLYRRAGNSPANATDPSGMETYWEIGGYFASTFVHNVGVTVSTAGKTIWKTGEEMGEEMGDAIGTHVARTWYSPQEEMTALHETVTTTAAGLSQLAQTVYEDPVGVSQSFGASSLRYLDRLTSDPETSGQLLGHGAVVWASAGAGGAAANATRSIAAAGNLSAAAGRASAAMRTLIPSRRLREGLEEATELTDDLGRAIAPSSAATTRTPVKLAEAGEDLFVGGYGQVRRANIKSGLNPTHTPHHSVQDAVSSTSHSTGVSINMRKDLHALTRTFRKPVEEGLSLRQHLSKDVWDIKNIWSIRELHG